MLSDVTGAITGNMKSGLIISASDVRGEIVFFLRHKAQAERDRSRRMALKGEIADARARASALSEIADEIEAAKIL